MLETKMQMFNDGILELIVAETIEKTSENDFRDILQKLGGWPVLEGNGWNESNFDWKKTDLKLRKMGYNLNSFITFYVDLDWKNTSRRVIYVRFEEKYK